MAGDAAPGPSAAGGGVEGSRRPERSRRSSNTLSISAVGTRPSEGPAVDAARLDVGVIKMALDEPDNAYLSGLDFVNVPKEDLEELFVNDRVRERERGAPVAMPPAFCRRTHDQLRRWYRGMSKGERQRELARATEWEIVQNHDDRLAYDNLAKEWAVPAAPPEPQSDDPPLPRKCEGVTLEVVRNGRYDSEGRSAAELGFKHTIREGYRARADLSNPADDLWNFAPPIVGALRDGNDASKVCWVIEERARDVGEDQFEFHSIRHVDCTGGDLVGEKSLCTACEAAKRSLFRRFDFHVSQREKEFDPNIRHNLLERSATLERKARKHHHRESRRKSKQIARRDAVIERLLEETGVDVKINDHSDFVFHPDVQESVKKFLNTKLGADSMAEYAFDRAVHNHAVAKKSGKTAIRHCPLMIRLGAAVRRSMGHSGGLYDLIADIAGLPSSRTLRRYGASSSNVRDGIMHLNCRRARDMHKRTHGGVGRFHWSRHCIMGFDSMTCKGRFGVSRNTNEIVGVADDAFDTDVLLGELQTLEKNKDQPEEADMKIPGIAKHFLVFIATTWSPKGTKIQWLVARYGVPTITAPYLVRRIREIIHALVVYGFIVDTIAGDGASENRSAFKILATIDARELLGGTFSEDELEGLPLDFQIAFPHPHPLYKRITVVIGGEMPHWVKKFRNAYTNDTRSLVFRSKSMDLDMLYDVWKASGDADVTAGATLRKYKFTHDHFVLNSYLKMRVFLAVQIPSQTMITMIEAHCKNAAKLAKLEDYAPMIEIFRKVDRLVDIMNGISFKKNKDRNVELINTPRHRHIFELFDILRIFEEWKKESGGCTEKFITRESYEDLVWMVFGVAAVAGLYLEEDGNESMHQGRSGTDVCEHFFSMIRYINSNPTMQQCREGASTVGGGIGMAGKAFQTESKSNSKADVTAEELLAPIERDVGKRPAKKQKTGA